ncbi:MAG: choice-of-anchor M domain-containing protein [Winkia neuii]|uniref:choice-of-anchor M domain-containing protein n=1 Tax=Winkia neuii TaxID=33007 RepID=UPI00290254B9|nr:choice-of-anchor M domain-containing protein [Winkia neuii]MDU3135068.1 choice-of-anchor M domain-containing protein [Winkia neuii]
MKRKLLLIFTALALSVANLPIAQADELDQIISEDEQVAPLGENKVFAAGHADMGVRVQGGSAQIMVRDDSQDVPVWRHPQDVTFALSDKALQNLPAGTEYDFTGASAGQRVWVIPQAQIAGVPWLGWSSGDPALAKEAARGVTIEYCGHKGPGQFSVFEQDGGFSKPRLLWSSQKNKAQPIFTEIGSHAHANWVFTKPGVHLVAIRMRVEGPKPKTYETFLRFAVQTDPLAAAGQRWTGKMLDSSTSKEPARPVASRTKSFPYGYAVLGCGVVVVVVGVFLYVRASRKERQRAEER